MLILIFILSGGISSVIGGYFVKNRVAAFGCLIFGFILITWSALSMVYNIDSSNHPPMMTIGDPRNFH